MPGDEQDKARVVAPPPLIYLAALVFGLLLNRRSPTTFLPRTIARLLGWSLLGGGVLLAGAKDVTNSGGKEVPTRSRAVPTTTYCTAQETGRHPTR
jgi:hypothetical protein